jgi:polysaccharide deacetylase family protein (PEP-CTERM system associated)
MISNKYAILSMDIEDWHHLDYLTGMKLDHTYSMLDGIDVFLDILDRHNIKSTFFVLGELCSKAGDYLKKIAVHNHEIACHGLSHQRPLTMDVKTFYNEISKAKKMISNLTGKEVIGYRAPCYSIDRLRLNAVMEAGFLYDSSKIDFGEHPLYGDLGISDFQKVKDGIYRLGDFFEFKLSTQKVLNKNIPVSGGGYIRILPWFVMQKIVSGYIKKADTYVLYIHPFELSKKSLPVVKDLSYLTNKRFRTGLGTVENKLDILITALKNNGFSFRTFFEVRSEINVEGVI